MDGTILGTDVLHVTFLACVRRRPGTALRAALLFLFWRANAKRLLGVGAGPLAVARLPINTGVVAFGRAAHAAGRQVHIATAADVSLGRAVAVRFPFITSVMGSEAGINLKGANKAAALCRRFPGGFDYVGDSHADLPVWAAARTAIVVAPSRLLNWRASRLRKPLVILPRN
jgi:phosphoserine phosphatase